MFQGGSFHRRAHEGLTLVNRVHIRAFVIVASVACVASAAVAQSSSIQGTVFGPDGTAVDAAPVQARNPETGAIFRTVSTATGSYSLTGVSPGNYTLSVAMPGFAYLPFTE